MNQLQQIGNFITTLSDPSTWIIVGGVIILFFIVWLWRTQTIVNLLRDIKNNASKSEQSSPESDDR